MQVLFFYLLFLLRRRLIFSKYVLPNISRNVATKQILTLVQVHFLIYKLIKCNRYAKCGRGGITAYVTARRGRPSRAARQSRQVSPLSLASRPSALPPVSVFKSNIKQITCQYVSTFNKDQRIMQIRTNSTNISNTTVVYNTYIYTCMMLQVLKPILIQMYTLIDI